MGGRANCLQIADAAARAEGVKNILVLISGAAQAALNDGAIKNAIAVLRSKGAVVDLVSDQAVQHRQGRTAMTKSGVTYVNPPSAGPAQGMYSHVARMQPGELAFIAGQVAIDAKGNPVGAGDLAAQVPQVFENLGLILKDLGADF